MVNGCRVLAARDPLAALAALAARPCGFACLRIEAPGRADGDRATLTEVPQTIFYFFKNPQVSLSQWTLFTRIAQSLNYVLVSVPLWNQDNLNP